MKLHTVMQVKDVSKRIGNLPALGQPRRHVQVVPTLQQVIKNQIVDPL